MNHLIDSCKRAHYHLTKLEREGVISVLGIAVEYYNIFLYGYLSALIIEYFFPSTSPLILLMTILLSYFLGPIGAIICGHIGDVKGRKIILVWTLALVSVPSYVISLLPSFDGIGVVASIGFIVFRSIQTLAFGGDMIGLATFMLENVSRKHRGLYGGLMSMGAALGVMVASFMVSLANPLSAPEHFWKWRVLLGIGFVGVVLAFFFRRSIEETTVFRYYKKHAFIKGYPIIDLIKNHKRSLVRVVGLTALVPIITIVVFGFIPLHSIKHHHLSTRITMFSNTFALAIFLICAPVFGALSDKIGRKKVIGGVAMILLITAFPFYYILEINSLNNLFLSQLFFGLVSSAYYGVTFAICIENFPTHIRYTGVALGYYLTYAIFGGINGLLIIRLFSMETSAEIAPYIFLILGSIFVLIALANTKETVEVSLENDSMS